jgi:DNA transformation protein
VAVSSEFQSYVLEQLSGLGRVSARRMFGGVGLYHDDLFFAIIDDDTLYLKVDESNRSDYVSRGMKPFCPYPDKPEIQMSGYYTVPADVLEETTELALWARRSCQASLAAAARKRRKTPASKRSSRK